jgi:acyl CoA:acetate/3-ketoacid CoA transferase alpha subunit
MFRLMRFRMVAVNQPQVQVHLDERDLLWNLWPKARLQSGIRKAKVYTDETVKYGCFSTTGEPDNLVEALYDKKLERSYECRI